MHAVISYLNLPFPGEKELHIFQSQRVHTLVTGENSLPLPTILQDISIFLLLVRVYMPAKGGLAHSLISECLLMQFKIVQSFGFFCQR